MPTLALTYHLQALLEILRDDAEAARRAAETLVALCREHGLASYLIWAALPLAWARAKLGNRGAGAAEFDRRWRTAPARKTMTVSAVLSRAARGNRSRRGRRGSRPRRIDGALTLAAETGEHWFDAALHCVRGDILLNVRPDDPAPAEQAFLAAIAVAREQGARSFCLQAALKLAKLYQSTGRPADAHAVCAGARRLLHRLRSYRRSRKHKRCSIHWRKMIGSGMRSEETGPLTTDLKRPLRRLS